MNKYEIIVHWSDEDDAYIAEVPELPGCIVHGASPDDAFTEIQEAMTLWIDTAKKRGIDLTG